jgi:SIR2-like domain
VLFIGAGASRAASLPLTEELLSRVLGTGRPSWTRVHSERIWRAQLLNAFRVLYPLGDSPGFQPRVTDFFTLLEVVASVHGGRVRLPIEARQLLADLQNEIALGLSHDLNALSYDELPHSRWFSATSSPRIVITTNWDTVVERSAQKVGKEVLFSWPRDKNGRRLARLRRDQLLILKLHGSIDWGLATQRTHRYRAAQWYSLLTDPIGVTSHFTRGRITADTPLRSRVLEGTASPNQVYFVAPLMATMAFGKQWSIAALESVWDDAYWSLSRARAISLVGYSFPDDDLEIRSLLRVTTRKPSASELDPNVLIEVVNPSPDAHDRARNALGGVALSDFRTAQDWLPHS